VRRCVTGRTRQMGGSLTGDHRGTAHGAFGVGVEQCTDVTLARGGFDDRGRTERFSGVVIVVGHDAWRVARHTGQVGAWLTITNGAPCATPMRTSPSQSAHRYHAHCVEAHQAVTFEAHRRVTGHHVPHPIADAVSIVSAIRRS
jgi:hypothetical protein